MLKIAVLVVFLLLGSYVGYLDALVSLDQVKADQEFAMDDELFPLDREIAQLESIIAAQEVIFEGEQAQAEEELRAEEEALKAEEAGLDAVPEEELNVFKSQLLTKQADVDEKKEETAELTEKQKERLEAQKKRLEEAKKARAERAKELAERKKVEEEDKSLLDRVTDKVSELQEEKEEAAVFEVDWSTRPGTIPASIRMSVQDKTGRNTELEQVHVNQIAAALSLMPPDFEERLKSITMVYGDDRMRRGVAGFKIVFFKGEERDIFRVVVHEFGHIWDLYQEVREGDLSPYHHGPYQVPDGDPTADYYHYTWENDFNKFHDKLAFPSGYGSSIPPEDFAETFALYILQGNTFRAWAESNDVIKQKYEFLKNVVYDGREFQSTNVVNDRPYDITKLPVNYNDLF